MSGKVVVYMDRVGLLCAGLLFVLAGFVALILDGPDVDAGFSLGIGVALTLVAVRVWRAPRESQDTD